MNGKRTDRIKILLLFLASVTIVYPFLWMVGNSLKNQKEMINRPWSLIPEYARWTNYAEAWRIGRIGDAFLNSTLVAVCSLILIVILCCFASYALARIEFKGRRLVLTAFISTILLPVQVLLIPLYKIEDALGLLDTHADLILPYTAIGLPLSIFLLTAFLKVIPVELEESASLDGCSRFRMLWSIILPLSRPGLATIVIFQFMNVWNEFSLALTVIHNPELRTIPLALANFKGQWGLMDFNRLFAALMITSIPIIAVFVVF